MSFFHTHIHSEGSILDGYSIVKDIARIAKENGDEAVSLTDHGSLAQALNLYKAGLEYEIKTTQGLEGYITPNLNDKTKESPTWHLVLLAKNRRGLDNLFALSEIAWTQGFYSKPRFDYLHLRAYSEGLLATSSCMAGEIARAIAEQDLDKALEAAYRYKSIFGEDFYIELQPGNTKELNCSLAELANATGIKTTVAVDAHFDLEENKSMQEILLAAQQIPSMKKSDLDYAKLMFQQSRSDTSLISKINTLWPNRKLRYDKLDLYIMSREEVVERMCAQGFDGSELADTSLEMADKCEQVEFKLGVSYLPKGTPEPEMNSDRYLEELVYDGLKKRGLVHDNEYIKRAREELEIIKDKYFADYFLIVWDLINEARSRNIYVGTGRGSACSSLVCYALTITGIDPIEDDLLFFRFIDPERPDWPDIDIDFEHNRRDEMKLYLRERWLNTLSISTYTRYHGKSLIKSIARVLAIPLEEVIKVTTKFDSIQEYQESDDDKLIAFRNRYPEILTAAKKLDEHITAAGAHAAGVVLADRPMNLIVPIETRKDPNDKNKRIQVCAFDMNDVAELGLQKLDLLALANLTNIHDCVDMIKDRHAIEIDWEHLERNDPAVLAELSKGNTAGVFQAESSVFRKLLVEIGVDSFNDLVASNALVRPGASNLVKDYIAGKKGKVKYFHHSLEPFTKDTMGQMIYQEQIMKVCVELAGMSWAKTNGLRKCIGKKLSREEFAPYHDPLIDGLTEHMSAKEAELLWQQWLRSSQYLFNKAHAVAYSYIGIVTAWLKIHYPTEFMYALLKSERKDTTRMTYMLEAHRLGIDILGPNVLESDAEMQMLPDGSLRFGLGDIKNVGSAAVKELIAKRPFIDWEDFNERTAARKCNSRVIESLVAVDALRDIANAPFNDEARANYQEYLNYPVDLEEIAGIDLETVSIEDLGESFALLLGVVKNVKRTDTYMRLDLEDMTGVTTCFGTSSNDLKDGEVVIALVGDKSMICYARVKGLLHRKEHDNLTDFEKLILTQELWEPYKILADYNFGGIDDEKSLVIPLSVKAVTTKAGKRMCFAYVIDQDLEIEKLTIFPAQWPTIEPLLHEWEPLCVRFSSIRGGGKTLYAENIIAAKQIVERKEIASRNS